MDIEKYIKLFFKKVECESVDIYNEFSFQHELGMFLRCTKENPYKVEFKRNISFFNSDADCLKSEMDIVLYHPDRDDKYAIELKFPRNGQYPESMFNFVKDIKFMEQVKQLGFTNTYAITYVEDKLFYSGAKLSGIYSYFRGHKNLHGEVHNPKGRKKETLSISGNHQVKWLPLSNEGRYYIISI